MRPATDKKTKRKDGLKRQGEIMAAALELFGQKGYAATSIDDIIAAAGTARGTFYLHFAGKSDLFAMIVETYLGQLEAMIRTLDISLDVPSADLRQLYRDAARTLAAIPAVKPFVRIMLLEAVGSGTQERIKAFFDEVTRITAKYIAEAQRSGKVVRSLDPLALALCIVGAVKELVQRWAAPRARFDIGSGIDTALEVYFRGMLT